MTSWIIYLERLCISRCSRAQGACVQRTEPRTTLSYCTQSDDILYRRRSIYCSPGQRCNAEVSQRTAHQLSAITVTTIEESGRKSVSVNQHHHHGEVSTNAVFSRAAWGWILPGYCTMRSTSSRAYAIGLLSYPIIANL
jgi:hypothetical protein